MADSKVNVELTATLRTGLHRYTFPQADDAHVILDLWHGISNRPTDSQVTIADDHTLTGFRRSDGWGGDKVFYFVIEFSRPFDSAGVATDHKPAEGKEAKGRNVQAHVDFKTKAGEVIEARVALSTVSVEGARKNLAAELPGWDFDATAAAAFTAWDRALAPVQVESRDENFKQTFYSSVYHTLVAPTVLNDVDGQVRGPDGKVHTVKGFDYYTELSFWDTFRAEHPLLTLTQPNRVNDFVRTCLAHFRFANPDNRYLPVWANGGKETNCMIGNHSIPVIVDAYLKGFRDWDAGEALADMIGSTNLNREFLDSYRDHGYVVQKKDEQGAAKTLEYCYDDICIARMARAMGKPDVASTYEKRAKNWQNVFDRETGFMRSRDAAGAWVKPFDPKRIDMSCYTEANAWHYEFFVPHEVPGLIEKLGGDAKFVAKLDGMFDPTQKIPNSLQDITGVIGMYAHGNEPCHHVAYLYNYAGKPGRRRPWCARSPTRSTTTPVRASAATTTAARPRPGTSSPPWDSTRSTRPTASMSSAARWPTRPRSRLTLATTRAASSRSSPRTTRPGTCTSSPPPSTGSRTRGAGSLTIRSSPAVRWNCRWDRTPTRAGAPPVRIGRAPLSGSNPWRNVRCDRSRCPSGGVLPSRRTMLLRRRAPGSTRSL